MPLRRLPSWQEGTLRVIFQSATIARTEGLAQKFLGTMLLAKLAAVVGWII